MRFSIMTTLSALLATVAAMPAIGTRPAPEGGRKVFAHYMLGLTSNQTPEEWLVDIKDAKAAGIDGFALNAGSNDAWSEEQLQFAYDTAAAEKDFVIFISFDMNDALKPWDVQTVSGWINQYKDSPAQFAVDGKPFVSTFEGVYFADSWAEVEKTVGDIYLVPDWSSLGAAGVADHLDKIDGAFSWDAWSTTAERKTTVADLDYVSTLGSEKSYMMGVSPFFYTNLPQWEKNWLWASDSLWYDRWNQVLQVMPDFVEIITWNDFGESHYIGSQMREEAIVENADRYVKNVPHAGLRDILPYYIASYKAGKRVQVEEDVAVFWYRQTPKDVGDGAGTTCDNSGDVSAKDCVKDAVYIMTISDQANTVTVAIGGESKEYKVPSGSKLVEVPFAGRTGDVTVTLGSGATATGPAPITNEAVDGLANFNYVVGSTKGGEQKAVDPEIMEILSPEMMEMEILSPEMMKMEFLSPEMMEMEIPSGDGDSFPGPSSVGR